MTLFDRAARAAHRVAIRPVFAELVTIRARRVAAGPNSRPQSDASRTAIIEAHGAFAVRFSDLKVSDAHDPRADNRLSTASEIQTVQLALADLPWKPVAGDRVERLVDGVTYTIEGPGDEDGAGHVTYRLSLARTDP